MGQIHLPSWHKQEVDRNILKSSFSGCGTSDRGGGIEAGYAVTSPAPPTALEPEGGVQGAPWVGRGAEEGDQGGENVGLASWGGEGGTREPWAGRESLSGLSGFCWGIVSTCESGKYLRWERIRGNRPAIQGWCLFHSCLEKFGTPGPEAEASQGPCVCGGWPRLRALLHFCLESL